MDTTLLVVLVVTGVVVLGVLLGWLVWAWLAARRLDEDEFDDAPKSGQ